MKVVMKHLQRDKKSGRLSYRRRFPQDLVSLIPSASASGAGRRELKVSLRSSEINDPVARDRYAEAEQQYEALVGMARRVADKSYDELNQALIHFLSEAYLQERLKLDEDARWGRLSSSPVAYPDKGDLEEVFIECREMLEDYDSDSLIAYWQEWGLELASKKGFVLDPKDPNWADLCRALAEAACKVWLAVDKRIDGEEAVTPSAPVEPQKTHKSFDQRRTHLSILELYDRYAAVPGRNKKTVAQWRTYIERLVDFVGSDNVYQMNHDVMVSWRNHLRDQVTHRGNPLTAKTINGSYLGAVGALFAWAKGDGIIPVNHMAEVSKVSLPQIPRTRSKAFTKEEAIAILRATSVKITTREGGDLRNAKRWCPWLMAYSGARVNEITQLRKEDIFERDGIWVMHITPEAGSVKSKEDRMVPLHSDIIEQGFIKFVEAKSAGPLFYDPTKRRSDNAINRQANRLGSKLAAWVKSLGIEGVKPNHAWRHYFSSAAVRYELDPRVTKAITGHSTSDVHDKTYLESLPDHVDILKREIEKIPRFEVANYS